MIRRLYTVLVYIVLPLLPVRLWWRGRKERGYRERIGERFGRYEGTRVSQQPVVWIHAVSLGETRACVPLVDRVKRAFPAATVLVTHMTATGREAGRALFGERVAQAWLPYDAPFAVRAFLRHWRPVAGLIMETELWPNVVAVSAAEAIPLFLVNARLSARSAAGYARVPSLVRPLLAALTGVAAQTKADGERLAALGAQAPVVTGNLKFDLEIPDAALALAREFRVRFGESRPTWVAGSTRDGEEALILDALARSSLPQSTLTVIVPRHPQRFAAVAELLRQQGVPFVARSTNALVTAEIAVVLGDSMGELPAYYAAADVAFVGGSLLPFGAHTLIEPLAVGTPVLIGPHTFNFAEATANALAAGAAREVADADQLVRAVAALIADPPARAEMRDAALAFRAAHRGAADRLWAWLRPQIDAALATQPGIPGRRGDSA
jgi:3-deoxy-D-manno-octulosonic-acid transferase